MAKLTAKQEAFKQEYLVDLNQTQAAIRAGYKPKYAAQIACELMKKPAVKEAIDMAMADRAGRTGVNVDRVIRELARIAFVKASDVISMSDATILEEADADDLAAIASVKVKQMYGDIEGIEREVKLCDKLRALELLGKHLGMFSDKLQITGAMPVQIVDDVPQTAAIGFQSGEVNEAGDEE